MDYFIFIIYSSDKHLKSIIFYKILILIISVEIVLDGY